LSLGSIAAVKRGEKKVEVLDSRNTLDLWLKKVPVGVGTRPKIQDLKKFEEFVRENRDKTQKQMAQLWGDEATQQNISYACKKLEITRKKNLWLSRKR
jgi:hypothetical protein